MLTNQITKIKNANALTALAFKLFGFELLIGSKWDSEIEFQYF